MTHRVARGRSRVVVAGILAVTAGSVLAVGVAAHTSHTSASLNINAYTSGSANNYFYGAVTSGQERCAVGRRVKVIRRRPGDDEVFGADTSLESPSGTGPYTVTAPTGDTPPGHYYSKTRRIDVAPGGAHTHYCDAARSDDVDVGP